MTSLMDWDLAFVVTAVFAAALLYSSVGHGGASAYLAIMTLAGYGREAIVPTVLVLNILVTLWGSLNYYRAGHLDFRLLRPFVIASIPAAFAGGMLSMSQAAFEAVLGPVLALAGLRFILFSKAMVARPGRSDQALWLGGLGMGGALGFLAGMSGIGGGIFLSPLLLLMGWADAKKTAAVSAAFIVLNSASGLTAHVLRGSVEWVLLGTLAATVILGGALGSYAGAFRVTPVTLQRLLGAVLLWAAFKLMKGLAAP